ncbi:MAG: alpha/beta fold hydrolase [Pseudonocardiaceae bacterium]
MTTLDVLGGHLYYEETGNGRPLVLLHGGALDHRMWDQQVSDLARRARVVTVDARGHGRSSTPTEPFRQCDDVAALVRHLDVGPATLVGLSMGGGTAVDTTLEYPELVHALVVSGGGTNEPYFRDPWVLTIQAEWARAQREGDAAGWVEAFLLFAAGPHRRLDDVDPDVVERCRVMGMETVTEHARPDAVAPGHVRGSWDRLGEVTVPVLSIVGGVDSDDHLEMAARLVDSVALGSTVVIDDTAHYPNMERPDAFGAALDAFLDATE